MANAYFKLCNGFFQRSQWLAKHAMLIGIIDPNRHSWFYGMFDKQIYVEYAILWSVAKLWIKQIDSSIHNLPTT